MTRSYCDFLIDLLQPWAVVTAKSMFGGFGLYRQGQIFGIVADNMLYLKVTDSNRADYEAAGSSPFTYVAKGKRAQMSYWQVPAEVVDDADELCRWADKAYRASLHAKASKKTR